MLIVTMPSISRCCSPAVVAPSLIELPGLVTHVAMGESSNGSGAVVRVGSLPNSPATNPQRIDFDDASHVASTTGINGGLAANLVSGKNFRIKANAAGAAVNAAYFTLGRGSIVVVARCKWSPGISNQTHTIMTAGGEAFVGWRFYLDRGSGDILKLGASTRGADGITDTLVGPTVTFDEWWTCVFVYNAETNVQTIYALQGSGTELSASSGALDERELNPTGTVYIGSAGGDRYLEGVMCDLFYAKFVAGTSPWDIAKIRLVHNSGTPQTFATAFTVPTPNSPEPASPPFSNEQITANWLNTTTTGTEGLYWFKAYRMQSGGCRFFWSSDHGASATAVSGVYTATSAGPGTAPTSFAQIANIPESGTLSGFTVDMVGTPTYRYQANDAASKPHYLYLNYISQPPPSGASDLEQTYLYRSATENFATAEYVGVVLVGTALRNWDGYARIYDDGELPAITNYLCAHNSDLAGGPASFVTSADPKTFSVSSSDYEDHVSVFPARIQCDWHQNIFTPDAGVRYYSVGRCAFPTGRGVGLVEIEFVGGIPRPTGKIWQLGSLDTDVFPNVGYTQEVMAFWESNVLYVYRLRGFYPPAFSSPGISYEQIDLQTYTFPA